MAAPYWVSVVVVFLMTVRNGVTVIDPNNLAPIVQEILNRYTPHYNGANNNRNPRMFSVAVSVPYNEKANMFDVSKVPDDGEAVRTKILNCDIYKGDRVVAATVLRWPDVLDQCPDAPVQWPEIWQRCRGKQIKTWADVQEKCRENEIQYAEADHAEFRTLQHVSSLAKSQQKSKEDMMVFYVRDSPCARICTDPHNTQNILSKVQDIMKWKDYVVVFSNIFRPENNNPERVNELRESLKRLGGAIADQGSKVKDKSSNGLQHIFRCYMQQEMDENKMKCFSCINNGKVAPKCILA